MYSILFWIVSYSCDESSRRLQLLKENMANSYLKESWFNSKNNGNDTLSPNLKVVSTLAVEHTCERRSWPHNAFHLSVIVRTEYKRWWAHKNHLRKQTFLFNNELTFHFHRENSIHTFFWIFLIYEIYIHFFKHINLYTNKCVWCQTLLSFHLPIFPPIIWIYSLWINQETYIHYTYLTYYSVLSISTIPINFAVNIYDI